MGNVQAPVPPAIVDAATEALKDIACDCDQKVDSEIDKDKETCRSIGDKKHECCEKAIKKHNDDGKKPELGGEKGYNKQGERIGPPPPRKKQSTEDLPSYFKRIGGTVWPDAALIVDGQPAKLYDFKFACPEGTGVRKPGQAPKSGPPQPPGFTPGKKGKKGQREKYSDLSTQMGIDPESQKQKPEVVHNGDCKK